MSQERLREETINFAAGPAQLPYEVYIYIIILASYTGEIAKNANINGLQAFLCGLNREPTTPSCNVCGARGGC